ncbi:hypothetical protein [Clostridium beijerinckii]|uniref:hypothetical protein n=1 Tax=Clostridium beijerinckii TaxID=1520 RepID=UPI0002FD30D9|nr:hypothetical protein [Clostridium beijerinckii]
MKDVFSYNTDINKTAYMNWRTNKHDYINNMINVADGFMKSSLILGKEIVNDNYGKRADVIIFPILFNANHAIELYLKAITWTLNVLLKNNKKIEGNHNINQMFNNMKSRVMEFETDKDRKAEFKKLTQNLSCYLDELKTTINDKESKKGQDNMDFARYPFDNKYINHFYVDTYDNVAVDLENFINRFTEIGNNLSSIAQHYLYDFLEADN